MAFRGVVDEEELNINLEKEVQVVEVLLNETLGDTLNRKAMTAITSKTKLMEATLKEKEFDAYFCISLVLQGARNIFIMEVGKNVEVFVEQCEH